MQAGDVLVPQFADKNAYPYVYTKTGSTADNEIDAISGATITTNAVTNGVNAGVYYFQTMLQQGAGEGAANEIRKIRLQSGFITVLLKKTRRLF